MGKNKNTSKNISVDNILSKDKAEDMLDELTEISGVSEESQTIQMSAPKKSVPNSDSLEVEDNSKSIKPKKYYQTKGYIIYGSILIFISIITIVGNLWLYTYLSLPFVYNFYQAILAKPDIYIAIASLLIPALLTKWLSSLKNKKGFDKNDLWVYGGIFITIFFMAGTIELMTYNFPKGIETNDYLSRIYEANRSKTRIAKFLQPVRTAGVKLDQLEEKFVFDYDKNYRLILDDNDGKIEIDHSIITKKFLKANEESFIKLLGKNLANEEDIRNFLISGDIHNLFVNLSDEERIAILVSQFIKSHWEIISEWKAPKGGKFERMMEIVRRYHE